ncbi:Uma2 family endonuclease [Streptomyces sp. NBC_00162]|uniref:Uma2 family endonuclease n=1 Tax=Streptomyces sp. NBC_00162 TaxID=2903629 RepID=UPI00214B3EE5|nr:Uma2 family endonuclease [Streptomyces sp. NBC_00162]UUU41446.1 Uma2 family endonuclease [Streptomyces sp. NBC_00162]
MAVIQHETTIAEAADRLSRELPGHRVEILQGRLTVTPPADGAHAESLTWLIEELLTAGARRAGLKYLQGIGLWLPSGPADFAVPDLSLVDADYRDAHVEKNCYAPHVFRMVVEITSSNWADDLGSKVDCYAQAGVPVYLISDRRHDEAILYTDPRGSEYRSRKAFKRGTSIFLPESLGITLELPVDRLLDGDED